jgi:uncharacterized integral membrane protein
MINLTGTWKTDRPRRKPRWPWVVGIIMLIVLVLLALNTHTATRTSVGVTVHMSAPSLNTDD